MLVHGLAFAGKYSLDDFDPSFAKDSGRFSAMTLVGVCGPVDNAADTRGNDC
jgi:hypothetical protein